MPIDDLNALSEEAAVGALLHCCGSIRWARRMAAARPFPGLEAMSVTADSIWASLEPEDWLEAFGAHPRIGGAGGACGASAACGASEAGGACGAAAPWPPPRPAGGRTARRYLFIVALPAKAPRKCSRFSNGGSQRSAEELRLAAEEQRKIMRLRLAKLLDSGS